MQFIAYGLDLEDAITPLRLENLYSFLQSMMLHQQLSGYLEILEIKDVRRLDEGHLEPAISRIVGEDGKARYAIEKSARTRFVVTRQKKIILGGYKDIHIARGIDSESYTRQTAQYNAR